MAIDCTYSSVLKSGVPLTWKFDPNQPRDEDGQWTGGRSDPKNIVGRLLDRAKGLNKVEHEDYQPVHLTQNPKHTRFILPDGTRIAPGRLRDEHREIMHEAIHESLDEALIAGVVRYNPSEFGGVQFAGYLTEQQAQVIADDWNYLYKARLSVDAAPVKDGKPDYEGSSFGHIDPPFTADQLRNWSKRPKMPDGRRAMYGQMVTLKFDPNQPRDEEGQWVKGSGGKEYWTGAGKAPADSLKNPRTFTSEEGYQWHEQGPVAEWAKGLPYDDSRALGGYSGFGYHGINDYLRGLYKPKLVSEFVRAATPEEANAKFQITPGYLKQFPHPLGRSDTDWLPNDPLDRALDAEGHYVGHVVHNVFYKNPAGETVEFSVQRTAPDLAHQVELKRQADQIDDLIANRGYVLPEKIQVERGAYLPGVTLEQLQHMVDESTTWTEKGFTSTMVGDAAGRAKSYPALGKWESIYNRDSSAGSLVKHQDEVGAAIRFHIALPAGTKVASVEAVRRLDYGFPNIPNPDPIPQNDEFWKQHPEAWTIRDFNAKPTVSDKRLKESDQRSESELLIGSGSQYRAVRVQPGETYQTGDHSLKPVPIIEMWLEYVGGGSSDGRKKKAFDEAKHPRDDEGKFIQVTVAAVKKTKHGAFGKQLDMVEVEVSDTPQWEVQAHAKALPLLQARLPHLKITTEIAKVKRAFDPSQPRDAHGRWVAVMTGLQARHPVVARNYEKSSYTEMGSIGKHTKEVQEQWHQQITPAELKGISERWGSDVDRLMDHVIALHDIGKADAVEATGDKQDQHEYTLPILQDVLVKEGFSGQDVRLATELANHDLIGGLLQGSHRDTTTQNTVALQIQEKASSLRMDVADFATLQVAFFYADAGAYPYVVRNYMQRDAKGKLTLNKSGDIAAITALTQRKRAIDCSYVRVFKAFDESQHPRSGETGQFVPKIYRTAEDVETYSSWGGEIKHQWKERGNLVQGDILSRTNLPDVLYHVTTNAPAVALTGGLLGQHKDSGLGGGQEDGVSFTTSHEDAEVIQRELIRSIEISRGDVGIEAMARYAKEDERSAGLPEGSLDHAVEFSHESWNVDSPNIGKTHIWDETKPEGERYVEGPPASAVEAERVRRSLLKDALNAYLIAREGAAERAAGHKVESLKNPILFGGQEQLAKVSPFDVKILEVPSSQIPPTALVTTGSDKFLHEVRVYADVPVRRKKFDPSQPRDKQGQWTSTVGDKKSWYRSGGGWNESAEGKQPYGWDLPRGEGYTVPSITHKVIRGKTLGAWGNSHGQSQAITGSAATEMGIEGYTVQAGDQEWSSSLAHRFLTEIAADTTGSEEVLHHSFENVRKTNFQVGDTLRLPLTATSGDVGGYGHRLDQEDQEGQPTVFEFEKGTQMMAYSASATQADVRNGDIDSVAAGMKESGFVWSEAIVAGKFEVLGVREEYMGSQHNHTLEMSRTPHDTPQVYGLVVKLKQIGTFDPVKKVWVSRG